MRQVRTLVLRVWCGQAPRFEPVRPEGDRWVLGRDTVDGDSRMSRRHCEVRLAGGQWTFVDLGSANGTYVDARPVGGTLHVKGWRVLMIGRSLFVPLVVRAGVPLRMRHNDDDILGPSMHGVIEAARAAAGQGPVVVLAGPTGCGFEAPAQELHRALGEVGEFAAVHVHEPAPTRLPTTGTLLVEGGESPARYLESATVRRALQSPGLRVCLGVTRRADEPCELPPELADAGVVRVPRLESRVEEIPWWVRHAVRTHPSLAGREIDVTLPEACLLRPWAQGVPDLIGAVQDAVEEAHRAGRPRVMGRHLAESAGFPLGEAKDGAVVLPPPRGRREPPSHLRERALVAAVLQTHADDRAAAAKALGISVEALEQWIRRHGLDRPDEAVVSESLESLESFELMEVDADEGEPQG
mgnify:CR=1 FL=1